MAQKQDRVTRFWIDCDRCGSQLTPRLESYPECMTLARNNGWLLQTFRARDEQLKPCEVHVEFCPSCAAEVLGGRGAAKPSSRFRFEKKDRTPSGVSGYAILDVIEGGPVAYTFLAAEAERLCTLLNLGEAVAPAEAEEAAEANLEEVKP